MEVRVIRQLQKGFGPGSVICLNPLGNCIVDLVFQIAGLADMQALCVHRDDLNGTELLGFELEATKRLCYSRWTVAAGLTCERKLPILQCRVDL